MQSRSIRRSGQPTWAIAFSNAGFDRDLIRGRHYGQRSLVLMQIAELERERDAVVETEACDKASRMIQQLTALRGIGVQSATVLVREAFVRRFANGKALGSYAGLASSPYSSGGIDREQGIGKAGNRRVRTVMVELAWLWTRYSPVPLRFVGSANGLEPPGGVFAKLW
jgi:transposase